MKNDIVGNWDSWRFTNLNGDDTRRAILRLFSKKKIRKGKSKMHDDENHPKWWIFHFFIVLQAIQLPFWCIWPSWNFGENPTMMEYWAEVLKGGGEVNEIKWKFSRALDSPEARVRNTTRVNSKHNLEIYLEVANLMKREDGENRTFETDIEPWFDIITKPSMDFWHY